MKKVIFCFIKLNTVSETTSLIQNKLEHCVNVNNQKTIIFKQTVYWQCFSPEPMH